MYIYAVYDYQLIIETNRDPDSARRFSGRRIAVDLRMCSLRPQGGPWWPGVVADRRSKSPALGSTNVQQTGSVAFHGEIVEGLGSFRGNAVLL